MKKFSELSEQEVISVGLELKRMLESDAFYYAKTLIAENNMAAFFTSNPGDTAAREEAYRSNQALSHLLAQMNSIILVADNIEKANGKEEY